MDRVDCGEEGVGFGVSSAAAAVDCRPAWPREAEPVNIINR